MTPRNRKPKPIQQAISKFVENYPRKRELKRGMILSLWPQIVGPKIRLQCEDVYFKGSKLIVHVKDPSWRHEIHMQRFSIMQRLNNKVNDDIISEIIIRS